MSVKYLCHRCSIYETCLLKDLFKHLQKKTKCIKKIEAYNYSDDQLLIKSLLPCDEGNNNINNINIDHLSNSSLLYNNLDEVINYLMEINKKGIKTCKFCNEKFLKPCDLRKHVITSCFYNDIKKRSNIPNNNNGININGNNNSIVNNNNNNITNNITNNISNNIYVDIKTPIPFDDNWDTSHIDEKMKVFLLFNKLMYTSFLEEILKNDTNLNVIIDKNSNSGIVYKNDIEEYIEMKTNDIVNKTMEKLKNQLLNMNNETKEIVFDENNIYNRRMITKKFIDYTKDKELQEQVMDCISNVYNKNKDNAIKISKKILNK